MPSLQKGTRVSEIWRGIKIVIHRYSFLSNIALNHNGFVKLSVFQSIYSPRFSFFHHFLYSHRQRILEDDPELHVFAGSFNDYRLFRAAIRIPSHSPIWNKALAKLRDNRSEQQILEFLELAAIAEELGGK